MKGVIGRTWQLVRHDGADFNGIFGGLDSGAYDCVASGTTITPEREKIADFCTPYAVSGQSLVVDVTRQLRVGSDGAESTGRSHTHDARKRRHLTALIMSASNY